MRVTGLMLASPVHAPISIAGSFILWSSLRDYANVLHLSTGDELRDAIRKGTELGKLAKEYVDSGRFVPDELILRIVDSMLSDSKKSGWILDGFPRNKSQLSSLDEFLERRKDNIYKAVYFEVSDTTLLERVKKRHHETQRSDDTLEIYEQRLKTYREATSPLIDIYESRGNLLRINGEQNVDRVFSDLKKSLGI
jgi:adenylate kinase